MRRFACSLPLVVLLFLAVLTQVALPRARASSQTGTAPGSAVASTVLAKAQQSMGLSSSSPIPLSATGQVVVTSTQQTIAISIDVLSPAVYRVQIGSGSSAYIWTANSGAVSTQTHGVVHRLRMHTSFYQRCELIPPYGVMGDITQVATPQIVSNGTSANPVLQFQYQLPDLQGNDFTVTKQAEIDSASFLPVRVREIQINEGNPDVRAQFEFVFSDYRPTGTLVLPYHIEVHVDGQLLQVITIQQFVINASLDPAEFSVEGN
jgi:hypothetical protein